MKTLLYNLQESAAAAPTCAKIWIAGVRNGVAEWPAVIGDVAQILLVLLTPIAVACGIVRAYVRNRRLARAREMFLKDLHAFDPLAVMAAKAWTESAAKSQFMDLHLKTVYSRRREPTWFTRKPLKR